MLLAADDHRIDLCDIFGQDVIPGTDHHVIGCEEDRRKSLYPMVRTDSAGSGPRGVFLELRLPASIHYHTFRVAGRIRQLLEKLINKSAEPGAQRLA